MLCVHEIVCAIQTGAATHTLVHGGRTRSFIINLPQHDAKEPLPVVLVLHGYTNTASWMCSTANVATFSNSERFVGVCPSGVGNSWNAGSCCGQAQAERVDDVGFARAIVAYIKRHGVGVDDRRVYATGFSNGGMLSYRLVCEASDVFMGAASMAGSYLTGAFPCRPTAPRPVVAFHDTLDTVVPHATANPNYKAYVNEVQRCPLQHQLVYSNPAFYWMACYQRSPCALASKSVWCT